MANDVYANGMEIACKAASGKTIAALPDVCLSPPSPPAGPIPIPYPNTAYASDTTDGSKTVQISGKEVVLKDKSVFKKSTGDEAATKSLGMGVITHVIQGKVNFVSWSMDVKIEAENAARHLDLTLHNEASVPANTPCWPYLDQTIMFSDHPCRQDAARVAFCCSGKPEEDCPPVGSGYGDNDCVKAKRCMLSPYDPKHCCADQTPHHLVPKRGFKDFGAYDADKAPCVCAEGWSWHRNDRSTFPKPEKTHSDLHDIQDYLEREIIDNPPAGRAPSKAMNYSEARDNALAAHGAAFPDAGCNPDCIARQLDNYHKKTVGVNDGDLLDTSGGVRGLEKHGDEALDRVDQAKQIRSTLQSRAGSVAPQAPGLP